MALLQLHNVYKPGKDEIPDLPPVVALTLLSINSFIMKHIIFIEYIGSLLLCSRDTFSSKCYSV